MLQTNTDTKKQTIDLGKIDFNNTGKKINLVEIKVELKDNSVLSICGSVWNNQKTDIVSGGQNLDTLKPYFEHNSLFHKIWLLWKNYHLNDMQAGTTLQMAHLASIRHTYNSTIWNDKAPHEWACNELDKVGLLTTTHKNKPYKFGSRWIKKEIPLDVLEFLNVEVFNGVKNVTN